MTFAIHADGLTKRYRGRTVVDCLDLQVATGDRFGFLGPNGSGKSTTVRMLLGLVRPSAGSVRLLGRSMPRHARQVLPKVGALVEAPAFHTFLPARVELAALDSAGRGGARRSRRKRIEDALERVGLGDVDDRPISRFSLGMKQRLALAAALLRHPKLLILDEPTNGLDPQSIREIRDLLLELNAAGTTVFLSSHLLAEVEMLCTETAIVCDGRLVAHDSLNALCGPTGRVTLRTPDSDLAAHLLERVLEGREGHSLIARTLNPMALNAALVSAGVRVHELVVERRTLEDVFLELTGSDGGGGWEPAEDEQ
ncbi:MULTISPECIES: ABC transporter ATP-binding protein [Protofrankia]|uniref:ABC transporter related protein n=1 Tax=Candidatus Protofrankia datiscae TaxID=2716812 RepID=F8B4F5_9ACTN|nr:MULTISPECIES: ABC transporter ATP-binding protein [Protofrankia]AEH07896.1 ABC transporter related protein [Candidatus Protofrankia datiscae]